MCSDSEHSFSDTPLPSAPWEFLHLYGRTWCEFFSAARPARAIKCFDSGRISAPGALNAALWDAGPTVLDTVLIYRFAACCSPWPQAAHVKPPWLAAPQSAHDWTFKGARARSSTLASFFALGDGASAATLSSTSRPCAKSTLELPSSPTATASSARKDASRTRGSRTEEAARRTCVPARRASRRSSEMVPGASGPPPRAPAPTNAGPRER
ncbi:hypothetical protein M885DRAFT_14506 [Pelagophyceae sp. CCMP2097]|nr:hypothetical protein M885DRAFT_14506 [Pelagophyceae sp. CCMP2097]